MATIIKDDDDEGSPRWKKLKGYGKWATPNTSTVANDPSNQINRAKNEPNNPPPATSGIGASANTAKGQGISPTVSGPQSGPPGSGPKEQTITDGKTSVTRSLPTGKGHDFARAARQGYFQQHGTYPPCLNSFCKSYGKPHPNCLCYGDASDEEWANRPEYNSFLAKGGMVCQGPHRESCEHYATGAEVESNQNHFDNPGDSLDHVGAEKGLLHLLTKLGHNGRSENIHKHLEQYIDDSRRGHKLINDHVSKLIGKESLGLSPDKEKREALKKHLDELQTNPSELMDIGGNLGATLPMHAAMLGAKAGQSISYLKGLKPTQSQNAPLDQVQPTDKMAETKYNRQIDIANQPSLVLQHIKDGTLQPLDLATLNTVYPQLSQSLKPKAFGALVDAKEKGKEIPYHQKRGLGDLMGQPLETTMTPMAMQAIIKANTPMQAPQSQKQPRKASGIELKQINQVNQNSETPLQARLADKKQ